MFKRTARCKPRGDGSSRLNGLSSEAESTILVVTLVIEVLYVCAKRLVVPPALIARAAQGASRAKNAELARLAHAAQSSECCNLPDDDEAFDVVDADESRSDPYDTVESRLDDVPHSEPSRLCGGVNNVGLLNITPRRCRLSGLG
jgi:hypothetical protein